tara:strand:- start:11 stop:3412 length:3402 start_codon:yes stop_codon:yes gene_type:complete
LLQKEISLSDKYELREGKIFLTGVQALVRLPLIQKDLDEQNNLNTGGFISGYKGSPLGGYDLELDRAQKYLQEKSIHHQAGINEELGATAVWGSQQGEFKDRGKKDGVFGIWYGKGPGMDRSMDVFKHANAAGSSKYGGVLAVAGDDHAAKSSTLPHQSDHNFMSAFMPFLYPSGVEEIVRYGLLGFAMSRYSGCWTGFKIVSDVADSGKRYDVGVEQSPIIIPNEEFLGEYRDLSRNILYSDTPREQDYRLQRSKGFAAQEFVRANNIDYSIWKSDESRLGIITSGKSYNDVREALRWLGIDESRAKKLGLCIYKVGMPWPLEPQGVREFCEGLESILLVEEKRELIEHQVKWQLYNWKDTVRPTVVGKQDENGDWLLPAENDLPLQTIVEAISKRLHKITGDSELLERLEWFKRRNEFQEQTIAPIQRKPFFCSGCPHNSSLKLPEGKRALGGIGCHYMAVESVEGTEFFTQMGGEGTPWIGIAPFSKEEHIFANLGDGTYKHSGILAIRAALDANVNITYKILYNDAVAMTGGQEIGDNWNVEGTVKQMLAEGVKKVSILSEDPSRHKHLACKEVKSLHRDSIITEQEELSKYQGVSVLIFDQTCAAEKRRKRKRGLMEDPVKRVVINPEVCEGCGDCSIQSSCVSIEPLETSLGRKRKINQSNCNKDYTCIKGFCPSFITVDAQLKSDTVFREIGDLPDPERNINNEISNIMLTGIGGTGVLTISAILAYAAHFEDKDSSVMDMTGLAQKGGAVWSHIKIYEKGIKPFSQKISPGSADLLLACDAVVGTKPEIQEVVSDEKTTTVINNNTIPVSDFVTDRELDFKDNEVLEMITKTTKKVASSVPAIKISEVLSGDAIGTNMVMLGSAYQNGLIPLKAENIVNAIKLNGVGIERNIYNFSLGRLYVIDPENELFDFLSKDKIRELGFEELYEDRLSRIEKYDQRVVKDFQKTKEGIDSLLSTEVDSERLNIDAIKELYRVFAIKDEYEVARMHLETTSSVLDGQFKDWKNLSFYLSPPMLSFIKDKRTGRPRKIKVPGYIAIPMFKLLRSLSFLRGTIFDPLNLTSDRRRDLKHKRIFKQKIADINKLNSGEKAKKLRDLITASSNVKGYGPVRHEAFIKFKDQSNQIK